LALLILPTSLWAQVAAPELAAPLHWQEPFARLPATGAYVSMLRLDGVYELWTSPWLGMNREATRGESIQLTVARGPRPEQLGDVVNVQDLRPLINDVVDPQQTNRLAPWRALTRSYMIHDDQVGYVLFGCVVPEYFPGTVPLLPAIFTSPTGASNTWTYLGILKPEPKEESDRRGNSPVWSDGGGIVHLSNGRWRAYLDGYNTGISVAEADQLEGPWKFLRGATNELVDVTRRYSVDLHGGVGFPGVLRVSDTEWHLWISDGWPVKAIWHLWSKDGLDWNLYGRQPEITPHSVGDRPIKCLRAYVEPDGKHIAGLLSINDKWKNGEETWVCYLSRIPVGPPTEASAAK